MSSPQSNSFARLHISAWRQFGDVDLDLTRRLTILTGANGAGKTSLLSILGRHFDWPAQFVGTPYRDRSGVIHFRNGRIGRRLNEANEDRNSIGSLSYTNGVTSRLEINPSGNAIQELTVPQQQQVLGLYLSSHRSLGQYQTIPSIPSSFVASQQILAQYVNEIRSRYMGQYSGRGALSLMKEALLAAAVWGEGTKSVRSNPEALAIWEGFQGVLTQLLPESLKFERLEAEPPEIIVRTQTGRFAIDALSGGLSAIFELAWQIFLRSREQQTFVVCLDEPENHLHPTLQREMIPRLLQSFPNVQFIVATHSPLIVTSVGDANVYVLDYEEGLVRAELLDFVSKAASAEETLLEVLGLQSTMPMWAEAAYDEIIDRYLDRDFTPQVLRELRREMQAAGMGEHLPRAVALLAGEANSSEATE